MVNSPSKRAWILTKLMLNIKATKIITKASPQSAFVFIRNGHAMRHVNAGLQQEAWPG